MGWNHSSVNLHAACGCVRSCCQILKKLKEGCGLADSPRTETSWEQQATRRSFAVLEFNLDGSNLRVFA
jgi:hypothetical protein